MVAVLFCVVTITFFLVRLAPGGPFDRERKIPQAIEKQLLAKYRLDGTLWQQYTGYLGDLLRGDLRLSTKYRNRSVNEILAQTLPVTFTLGALAFLVASAVGVWLGAFAAIRRDTWADHGAMGLALLSISVPTFVTGPVFVLVFALWLGWLPVAGWGAPSQLVLPVLTLALPYAAYIARLMRTSLLEVLGRGGGALRLMVPVFRLGLGGPLGGGAPWMACIHVEDAARLILWACESPDIGGPVNAVMPQPVRNADFVRALARAVRRPAVLPVPAVLLRLLPGRMGAMFLDSQRVVPAVALRAGFSWRYPTPAEALAEAVGRSA